MVALALSPSGSSCGLVSPPGCTSTSAPVARRFSSERASSGKTFERAASSSMREVSEKAVKQSCESSPTITCSDRQDLAGRVNAFLRKRYPTKVGEHVSADIGVPVTTIQKWLERSSAPSSLVLLKMVNAYGPGSTRRNTPNAARGSRRISRNCRRSSTRSDRAS